MKLARRVMRLVVVLGAYPCIHCSAGKHCNGSSAGCGCSCATGK